MTNPFRTHDLAPVASQNIDVTPRPTRPPLAGPLRLNTDHSDAATSSEKSPPRAERLPSFRQLSKIADAAGEEATRPVQYPVPAQPVYPPPPMSNHSPNVAHQPYQHRSLVSPGMPMGPYGPQISPTSAQPDGFYSNSPPNMIPPAQGNPRRQSYPVSSHQYPPPLNSMATGGSSSGESYGHHSSMGDISTAQTTPLDPPPQSDGKSSYPLFPPSHSSMPPANQGPWHCDHPGCTASPFPTQYLLNSHATSHSPHRPHYCPVPGCPRGEGGKGFKRKNEMIRHGLTHSTPGYICPFCPDRAHRYPRPDNLQRHVRVQHVDKDRDDPLLREVLSQRGGAGSGSPVAAGGGGNNPNRGRRRRTGP